MFPTVLAVLPKVLPPTLKFLAPYKESLGNPSRHTIVYTATHNPDFLAALNAFVLKVCQLQFQYSSLVSFWATVVTEATAAMIDLARSGRKEVSIQQQEDVIMRILPTLSKGLSVNGIAELRIGCYMLVTVLASKAVLSNDALEALMNAVVSDWEGTTHAGLICLAVLSQRRSTIQLPRRTFEALLSIANLEDDLQILKAQYRVDNLVLGIINGILRKLRKKPSSKLLTKLRALTTPGLMDSTSTKAAVEAMLPLIQQAESTKAMGLVDPLTQVIVLLAVGDGAGATVKDFVLESSQASEALKQQLRGHFRDSALDVMMIDQDIPDVSEPLPEESFQDSMKKLTPLPAVPCSFFHIASSGFPDLVHLFALAIGSTQNLNRFLELPILRRSAIMTEPCFASFFARVWSGPFSVKARVAAINVLVREFDGKQLVMDVQALIPYLLYALADPVTQIRRTSSDLVMLITKAYKGAANASDGRTQLPVLGDKNMYDLKEDADGITDLTFNETLTLFEDFCVPNVEECVLDSTHIGRLLSDIMNGTAHREPKKEATIHFKSSWKHAVFLFLCGHAVNTPLRRVQGRLLSMLNKVAKVGGTSRTKVLLPLLRSCISEKEEVFLQSCTLDQIESGDFAKQVVGVVSPTDQYGIIALQALIKPEELQRHHLLASAALQHLVAIWPSIRESLKLSLAEGLLESALSNSALADEKTLNIDAMGVLRTIELPVSTLKSFLNGLPPLVVSATDEPGPAKRRKTNHTKEVARSGIGTTDGSPRKYTIVLELTNSSALDGRVELLGEIFKVLESMEYYRRQTGADLGYLEVIALNIAHDIICKHEVIMHLSSRRCTKLTESREPKPHGLIGLSSKQIYS